MRLLNIVLIVFLQAASLQAVVVVSDGKPAAKIYIAGPIAPPPDASVKKPKKARKPKDPADFLMRSNTAAVKDLNYHLQKMTGTTLEVVVTDDPADVQAPAIVLGELAVEMGATPAVDSPEAFRLLVKDDRVLIGATAGPGTLHGVYEALSKLGCDWVMPGEIGEIIPERKTVDITGWDESQSPDFAIRDLWYSGGTRIINSDESTRFGEWRRRNKMSNDETEPKMGNGHMWDPFIRKHQAEFDKDPTMLALRRMPNGVMKRSGPQLESTHPRVIELFVQDIKNHFEKNQLPKDAKVTFPFGPSDGLGYSESAESVAAGAGRIDPITGAPDVTDLLILMGNSILEKLGDEYPNVHLGFYSYSVHGDYPARYKPHPHLNVIFAPITFSRLHGFEDENSKTRFYYKGIVEQWGKLAKVQGNLLSYRGYNWNLAENIVPFTQLKMLGEDIPFYKKNGFIGSSVEACNGWATNGPHNYLYAKLCWNTSLDWKKVLTDYCQKSFGAGAPPMERYFHRLVDTQHAAGQEAGSYFAIHLIFDEAFVAAGEADIAEAIRLASSPREKTRIEYIGEGLQSLKLYLAYHAATMKFDFAAATVAYDAIRAQYDKNLALNSDLVSRLVPVYTKRFLSAFVTDAAKYSASPYDIVFKLPDELPTALDSTGNGHQMRLQDNAVNDSAYFKTRTYSTTWDAQGLGGYRGPIWYRVRFALPPDSKGKPIGLFLGGVDDEARVWINGQLVGTSGRKFSGPSAFDLTDGIRYDGENLLAIQIIRNSAANEIGVGGILRPSFLFTGPRLETKAPKPLELRRVLPGGGLGEVEEGEMPDRE